MQSSKMSFKNMVVAPHHLAAKTGSDIEILLNNTSKTLGARSQKKLPRETALFIAKCNSGHKDISLNF